MIIKCKRGRTQRLCCSFFTYASDGLVCPLTHKRSWQKYNPMCQWFEWRKEFRFVCRRLYNVHHWMRSEHFLNPTVVVMECMLKHFLNNCFRQPNNIPWLGPVQWWPNLGRLSQHGRKFLCFINVNRFYWGKKKKQNKKHERNWRRLLHNISQLPANSVEQS